jgi:hypothetical protein
MKILTSHYLISVYASLLIGFIGLKPTHAQSTSPEKEWSYLTEVYMLFPNMDGEVGVGNTITAPINANTSDIFGTLKLGGMIYLEMHNHQWSISSDFVFMNLEKEITPTTLIRAGTLGMDQYIWEVAGLYRVNDYLEVGAGGRLNHLVAQVQGERNVFPNDYEDFSAHQSKTFYDPILIARMSTDINKKWLFQFRGDLGGFGIGSDFTWQLQAYAGYRFTQLFQVTAGYRILGIDYDKGVNAQRFIFNMNEFGPVIRVGFNF